MNSAVSNKGSDGLNARDVRHYLLRRPKRAISEKSKRKSFSQAFIKLVSSSKSFNLTSKRIMFALEQIFVDSHERNATQIHRNYRAFLLVVAEIYYKSENVVRCDLLLVTLCTHICSSHNP
uniref:Uncharacterized protein n=1 Tax=Glossina austeni TaxID=7395 RepID=A0A1A9VEK0_GLOAU